MNLEWLNFVFPFADTAAPVGGYAHSCGLEGLVQEGVVTDRETLREFLLRDVKVSLRRVDLPVMAQALLATQKKDWGQVRVLDERAWALRPTRQLRESASKIGRQQWRLYERLWEAAEGPPARDLFRFYQTPVVAGVVFGLQGVPLEAGLRILSYQTFSTLLQAALKILPVGPIAVQELLHETMLSFEGEWDSVMELEEEDWGSFNPLWDIAASRHERAAARLFIS